MEYFELLRDITQKGLLIAKKGDVCAREKDTYNYYKFKTGHVWIPEYYLKGISKEEYVKKKFRMDNE